MLVHNLTLILIASGACLMLLSIKKFISLIRLSKKILFKVESKTLFLSKWQLLLMCFFLLGYFTVFILFFQNVQLAGNLFTGVIFFFGAIFVYFGIILQSDQLLSIQKQTLELITTNNQLIKTQSVTTFALAYQAELRDQETGKHLERTATYVEILAKELSRMPAYKSYITESYISDLVRAAPLHDIGKVGIPDAILHKPGKLNASEFEMIKKHCEYGAEVLKIADKKLGFDSFLKLAIQIVCFHHEKWNGQGYPRGLKGDNIPLSARIMAVADVYDAIRTNRCYKPAFSHEKAVEMIMAERGKHFDPDIVDAFYSKAREFYDVSVAFKD